MYLFEGCKSELLFVFCLFAAGNAKWEAIARMTEMRDRGISAFIGPDDSCTHEALAASAWNLPMIAFVRKIRQMFFV